MIYAKIGTDKTVPFGPVLAADGTMSSGALAYTDFKIFKNGTDGPLNASATATHKYEGVYALLLKAADLDAVGDYEVVLNKNPLSAAVLKITVLAANVYDSLFGTVSLAQVTAAAIATAVWQDATAGDFTVASSIGKGLYTSGIVPGGAGGLFIAGTNAATTITTSLTTGAITLTTPIEANVMQWKGATPFEMSGDAYAVVAHGTWGNAKLVRATNPANMLDVSSTGQVGLDFNNVKQAGSPTTLSNITIPTVMTTDTATTLTNVPPNSAGVTEILTRLPDATAGASGGLVICGANAAITADITGSLSGAVGSVAGAVTVAGASVTAIQSGLATSIELAAVQTHGDANWATADPPTVEEIDAELTAEHGAGNWTTAGTGAHQQTYTITDAATGLAIAAVAVRVSTDVTGVNVIASGTTNASGQFSFWHDLAGGTTVYVWRAKAGYTFTNPDTEAIP